MSVVQKIGETGKKPSDNSDILELSLRRYGSSKECTFNQPTTNSSDTVISSRRCSLFLRQRQMPQTIRARRTYRCSSQIHKYDVIPMFITIIQHYDPCSLLTHCSPGESFMGSACRSRHVSLRFRGKGLASSLLFWSSSSSVHAGVLQECRGAGLQLHSWTGRSALLHGVLPQLPARYIVTHSPACYTLIRALW